MVTPGLACRRDELAPVRHVELVVFAAGRQLPFTHVANAADCFRAAIESEKSIGETLNLLDGHDLTAWRFKGEQLRRTHAGGLRVWLPYWLVWPVILSIYRLARLILGPRIKLPFMFMPAGFAQGYRPLVFSTQRLTRVLDWQPPLSLDEALDATFAGEGSP